MSNDKRNIIYSGDHHFNVLMAKEFGVDVAIFIKNLYFLTQYVMSNNKNFYDNYFWVYNKLSAFQDFLPYYTEKQIRLIINKALKAKLILTGNYNNHKYDQTKWYCLTEKALAYYPDLEQKLNIRRQFESPTPNPLSSMGFEAQLPLQPAPALSCPNGQKYFPKRADTISQMGNRVFPKGQTYTNNIKNKIVNKNNNNNSDTYSHPDISVPPPSETVSVFCSSLAVKDHIERLVLDRGLTIDSSLTNEGVYYAYETNPKKSYAEVNKRINIFLKKVREKSWNVPHGYQGLTPQSIREKEEKEHQEKLQQYNEEAEAFRSIKKKLISGAPLNKINEPIETPLLTKKAPSEATLWGLKTMKQALGMC